MKRPPPRSTRTHTLFPYTTLFRSHRLEHRHLDALPLARALAVQQRHRDGVDRRDAHGLVDGDGRQIARLARRHRLDRRQPRHALDDVVIGGLVGIGAVLVEAEAAAIDQTRVDRPAIHGSRSEERLEGKESVSTCRYRWSPYH